MRLSMMSMVPMMIDHYSAEETVAMTREFALDGIDWVTCHGCDPRHLRRLTDDAGVPCVAYTFWVEELPSRDAAARRRALDLFKKELETAHTLGAPVLMVPTPGNKDMERGEWRRCWVDGFAAAMPLAQDAGVILTVENYPGAHSPFVLASDIREALDAIPGLRVTFDNGNAASGEPAAQSFRDVAESVVHSHFKDWEISATPTDTCHIAALDGRHYGPALICEGALSQAGVHRECLQAMKDAGYRGCINIEYESRHYRAYDGIRRAAEYLRAIAAEIGY